MLDKKFLALAAVVAISFDGGARHFAFADEEVRSVVPNLPAIRSGPGGGYVDRAAVGKTFSGEAPPSNNPGAPGIAPSAMSPGIAPSAVSPGTAPSAVSPGIAPSADSPGIAPSVVSPGIAPWAVSPGTAPSAVAPATAPSAVAPALTGDASQSLSTGLLLLRSNRNVEAVANLRRAVELAPDSSKAHHCLGLALAKTGENDNAILEFKKALDINPQSDMTWLTLGGLYQSRGMLDDAVAAYREYVTRFSTNKELAPTVVKVNQLIAGISGERDRLSRTRDENAALQNSYPQKQGLLNVPAQVPPTSITPLQTSTIRTAPSRPAHDDYLAEATRPGIVRWAQMPIKVYIRDAQNVSGYKPAWAAILQRSFMDWQKASNNLVRFEFVSSMSKPFDGIECIFESSGKAARLENEAEAGEAKMYVMPRTGDLHSGTITILTKNFSSALPLTDNRIRYICLHEIGHALGLSGHTDNPDDIMFLSTSFKDEWRELSPRDARTIQRFYSSQ